MRERIPREVHRISWPVHPFLLSEMVNGVTPKGLTKPLPLARHFENMGQVFIRSGTEKDDTYALFMTGGVVTQHKHFDANTFLIYKKGFLALDTGTRPQPGQHLYQYYARTVAHNGVSDPNARRETSKLLGSAGAWGARKKINQ